jgi:hypothetical protein
MTAFTPTRPVTLKTKNGPRTFHPGEVVKVDPVKAAPFVESGVLRPVGPSVPVEMMNPPIPPGWVVSYRGSTGQIMGGTVKAGRRHGGVWVFDLEDGTALPDGQILSVARVEGGRWLAAWTVKDWGLDGARLFAEG